jgi:hypothetical protein
VGIEPRDGDAGALHAGVPQRAVDDADRVPHALARDQVGHLPQRHVRGDARGPELAGDVELADEALHVEALLQVAQFILVGQPAQAQRMLVQRREQDGLGLAPLHRLGRQFQRLHAGGSGNGVGFGQHRSPAVHEVARQQGDAAGFETQIVQAVAHHGIEPLSGNPFAFRQQRRIGDQQHLGDLHIGGARQQLDRHFGTDAAGIAQQHGDAGTDGVHAGRHLIPP